MDKISFDLEDPWFDPTTPENREMYKLTVDPELAPDEAQNSYIF